MITSGSNHHRPGCSASCLIALVQRRPGRPAWCDTLPVRHFPRTLIQAARKFLCWKASSPMSLAIARRAPTCATPPGSRHAPASREGCLILVKLRQMSANETATLRLDTNAVQVWEHFTDRRLCRIFESPEERVRIEQVEANRPLFPQAQALAEILVLGGELKLTVGSRTQILAAGTWVRAGGPDAHRCLASMVAGSLGVTVYIKQGAVVEHPHPAPADPRS